MTRPGGTWQNWARTERVRSTTVEYPSTIEAVRRSVRSAAARGRLIKAVGTGKTSSGVKFGINERFSEHTMRFWFEAPKLY